MRRTRDGPSPRTARPSTAQGAAMTTKSQYPIDVLLSAGTKVTTVSTTLGGEKASAYPADGLGADQSRITGAIDGFRDEWSASVDKLMESIGGFGNSPPPSARSPAPSTPNSARP